MAQPAGDIDLPADNVGPFPDRQPLRIDKKDALV